MADTKRTTTIFHNYYHFHHELKEDDSCQSQKMYSKFQKMPHETDSSFKINLFVRVYFRARESQQCLITTLQTAYTLQPAAIQSWLREARLLS